MLLMIGEREGNPGSLDLYTLRNAEEPVLALVIDGVRLAREFGAHVRTRTDAITFSSDSKKTSNRLRKLFESYFGDEAHSRNSHPEDEVRVLSIIEMGKERVRLTFEDSKTDQEIGPSITGSLKNA